MTNALNGSNNPLVEPDALAPREGVSPLGGDSAPPFSPSDIEPMTESAGPVGGGVGVTLSGHGVDAVTEIPEQTPQCNHVTRLSNESAGPTKKSSRTDPAGQPTPAPEELQPNGPSLPDRAISQDEVRKECWRLARLDPVIAYPLQKEASAKLLGLKLPALDKIVKSCRKEIEKSKKDAERAATSTKSQDESHGQGRPLSFPEIEPWHEEVDGINLLDKIVEELNRYIVFPNRHQADAVALWILAVHAFDAWPIFPRLLVKAPTRNCGKSTVLAFVKRLVPKAFITENATVSSLFRIVEMMRPTLLLDEADAWLAKNEEVRAFINSGHRRDGAIIRNVPVQDGGYEPRAFSTFAPVAMAGIKNLPGTIESRSIIIAMKRRLANETIEQLRDSEEKSELIILARKAARWAKDNLEPLRTATPDTPTDIFNRDADNWHSLFAIAEAVGGEWPKRTREAAKILSKVESSGDELIMLLEDISAIFRERKEEKLKDWDKIAMQQLAELLPKREGRIWAEYGRFQKPITINGISAILMSEDSGVGIKSKTVRVQYMGNPVHKGYSRDMFEDAFRRYLGTV